MYAGQFILCGSSYSEDLRRRTRRLVYKYKFKIILCYEYNHYSLCTCIYTYT